MQVISLQPNRFQTVSKKIAYNEKIVLEIVHNVNMKNWITTYKGKLSKSLTDIINLDLTETQENVVDGLMKLVGNGCIAFEVKVNGLSGLLYPTVDKFVWAVRLCNEVHTVIPTVIPTVTPKVPQEVVHQVSQPSKVKQVSHVPEETLEVSSASAPDLTTDTTPLLDEIDPIQFLSNRYCRTLYTPSIVIHHFAKSTLPKMHILTRKTTQLAKDALCTLAVPSLDAFDSRYSNDANPWLLPGESNYRTSKILQDTLRARDLRLQILLNLELLTILRKEGKKETPQTPPKPTLTHSNHKNTRLRRRRLIPTLLGTALPSMPDFDTDLRTPQTLTSERSYSSTAKLIAGLFDRLCIDDAVLGLDYRDERSSWSFLSGVVTPFYANTHGRLLRELAVNTRGPSILLKLKGRQRRHHKRQHPSSSSASSSSTTKVTTSMQSSARPPIDLSQLRLARSHSSVGTASAADLARKTFSMGESDTAPTPVTVASPARFMNSKKRRLVAPVRQPIPPPTSLSSSSSLSQEQSQSSSSPSLPSLPPSPPPPLIFHENQIIEATPRKDKLTETPTTTRQTILTSPIPKRKLNFN